MFLFTAAANETSKRINFVANVNCIPSVHNPIEPLVILNAYGV